VMNCDKTFKIEDAATQRHFLKNVFATKVLFSEFRIFVASIFLKKCRSELASYYYYLFLEINYLTRDHSSVRCEH
jgi:hypothetical protein